MTQPYENIPTVLPGSDAARGVDAIGAYYKAHGTEGLDSAVQSVIEQYGGDPIKSSAMRGAAQELIEQNPGQAEAIAKHLVGTTLADPSVAADNANRDVIRQMANDGVNPAKLTPEQQQKYAMDAAQRAIADAGGPPMDSKARDAMEAQIREQIDAGASPGQAAAAAVAAYMVPAVAAAMSAGGFDIYGYVTFLVHGTVRYDFKAKETINVTDTAIHNYLADIKYDMKGHKYTIDAQTIKTSGTIETARAHTAQAEGQYDGTYFSLTGASGTAFPLMWTTADHQLLLTGAMVTISGLRFYGAVFDQDLFAAGASVKKAAGSGTWTKKFSGDHRKKLVDIQFGKKNTSSSGQTTI